MPSHLRAAQVVVDVESNVVDVEEVARRSLAAVFALHWRQLEMPSISNADVVEGCYSSLCNFRLDSFPIPVLAAVQRVANDANGASAWIVLLQRMKRSAPNTFDAALIRR